VKKVREIRLSEILNALLKMAWLIVLCTIIGAVIAFIYTVNFVTPLYSSSITLYVNNTRSTTITNGISASDLTTSQMLVSTYVNILETDRVLEKVSDVAAREGIDASPAEIRKMMTAGALDETEVFKVYISHADPYAAQKIANAIAEVAPDEITDIVDGSSTKIVDGAKVAQKPYTPNRMENMLIGAAVGLLLSAAFVVLQMLLDVRVKNEEDLEQISTMPVLGMIPDLAAEIKDQYGYASKSADHTEKEAEK
jgi:capsular polysaccharide biosynthesis protein